MLVSAGHLFVIIERTWSREGISLWMLCLGLLGELLFRTRPFVVLKMDAQCSVDGDGCADADE
jgi:hypothetical protein